MALVAIANSYARTCTGHDTSCTIHLGIVANYALVGFTDKSNSGEYFLATNSSGTWKVISKGGGWLNPADLQTLVPALGASNAAQLERVASADWIKP